MLYKTRGIVLHSIPYNDTYAIIYMYTEAFGCASYWVARSRKRSSLSKALFMPLSVLEMEVEHQSRRDLHRIRAIRPCFPQSALFIHPVKNALALFLSEVLFRVLWQTEPDPPLFAYLCEAIHVLEVADSGVANFHMVFLLRLLHYLGIRPNAVPYVAGNCFDMVNGIFVDRIPLHRHYLNPQESVVLIRLLKMNFENMSLYAFSRQDRINVIHRILDYYRLHLPDFPEIKSLPVLQSLFD